MIVRKRLAAEMCQVERPDRMRLYGVCGWPPPRLFRVCSEDATFRASQLRYHIGPDCGEN